MANPTYTGKRSKLPRDRAEWFPKNAVAQADERADKLRAEGCKVRVSYGAEIVLSIWNAATLCPPRRHPPRSFCAAFICA